MKYLKKIGIASMGIFIFFILLIRCTNEKKSSSIKIPLNHLVEDGKFKPKFNRALAPSISYLKKYPDFYELNLEKFKNIPSLDSFRIVSRSLDSDLFRYDLYSHKAISKEEYLKRVQKTEIDTNGLLAKNIKYGFNAISGFKNGQHLIIPDHNNNYDFSDDKVFNFPNDTIYSFFESESIKDLPFLDFKHQQSLNGDIFWMNRKIKFYPNPKHAFVYLLMNGTIDSVENRYTTMLAFKDYWHGEETIEETPLSIYLYGLKVPEYPEIVIRPTNVNWESFSQDNYLYHLGDTLTIKRNSYKIDSLRMKPDHLFLSKLKIAPKEKGWRMGEIMEDYDLTDLNGQPFKLLNKSSKDYLLLDFWGTWCIPCKELTPDIKQLYTNHSDKLDIVSIAFDNDIEDVKKYTLENEMNWYHSYIDRSNRNDPIGKKLKIKAYPTLILLDKENKIIMRGHSASLNEIKSFFESKQ